MTTVYTVLTPAKDIRTGDRVHLWEQDWRVLAAETYRRRTKLVLHRGDLPPLEMSFKPTREIEREEMA